MWGWAGRQGENSVWLELLSRLELCVAPNQSLHVVAPQSWLSREVLRENLGYVRFLICKWARKGIFVLRRCLGCAC